MFLFFSTANEERRRSDRRRSGVGDKDHLLEREKEREKEVGGEAENGGGGEKLRK